MQVVGPTAANVAPQPTNPAPQNVAASIVYSFVVDPFGRTVTISYGPAAGGPTRSTGVVALQPGEITNVQAIIARVLQADQGWASAPTVT